MDFPGIGLFFFFCFWKGTHTDNPSGHPLGLHWPISFFSPQCHSKGMGERAALQSNFLCCALLIAFGQCYRACKVPIRQGTERLSLHFHLHHRTGWEVHQIFFHYTIACLSTWSMLSSFQIGLTVPIQTSFWFCTYDTDGSNRISDVFQISPDGRLKCSMKSLIRLSLGLADCELYVTAVMIQ